MPLEMLLSVLVLFSVSDVISMDSNQMIKLLISHLKKGPTLSGTLVEWIGFEGLIISTACICFSFAPLLVLLRDPPARQINDDNEQATLRYTNYSSLDGDDREKQQSRERGR